MGFTWLDVSQMATGFQVGGHQAKEAADTHGQLQYLLPYTGTRARARTAKKIIKLPTL